MQISSSGPRGKGMKQSMLGTWGSGGQRPRSHEDEDILGGLAEASFLSRLSRVAFLVLVWSFMCLISIFSCSQLLC